MWNYLTENYKSKTEQAIDANLMMVSNRQEISPSLIPLTEEVSWHMAEILRPLLQNWCKCELKFTEAYGIWQFHRGEYEVIRSVTEETSGSLSAVVI